MPVITNSVLDGLRTTFEASFWNIFEETPQWYPKLCSVIPSSSKSNTYGWLMNSIFLREWLGARVIQNLQEHEYALVNKLWESTVELKRTDVEDDNLGVFAAMTMPNMAQSAKKHPDIRAAARIRENGTAFDSKAFFATDHPTYNTSGSGATTYSNLFTSRALTADNLNYVRSTMGAYIGENGYPLGVRGALLVVPPQLELAAMTIAHSTTYAIPTQGGGIGPTTAMATVDNAMRGWFDVLVVPELSVDADTWYLADVSKPIKPLIFQPRLETELVARFNPDDPLVFSLDTYAWGTRARYEVGYTVPYLMAKASA